MTRWAVSNTQDYLTRDGKPFFYLADTVWMAFANLPLSDWTRYLAQRKLQGFNALQISILPVTHDTSVSPANIDPFLPGADGNWDFGAYNDAYFAKAECMLEMAVEQGFVPVLGMLWCSYVPGTRCSQHSPVASAMPFAAVEPYAVFAAERFKRFDPIFFISGDTHFESPQEAPYYMAALKGVRQVCPDVLISMHLAPQGDLPRDFMDAVDFYMYQSGHGATRQDQAYLLAEKFAAYPVKRPVVNSEPCYEGHGRIGEPTRFSAFDVRKATWQSLLSGAKMGITYGAHGVWMFHRRGMKFLNARWSYEPYEWDVALDLPGAWDVSFAKWIFETYNLFDLEPVDLVVDEDGDPPGRTEIKAAANRSLTKVLVYSANSFAINLAVDLTGYRCVQIDLTSRRVAVPEIEMGATSRIAMHPLNGDALFLAVKEPAK